jgi:hypothetical protein
MQQSSLRARLFYWGIVVAMLGVGVVVRAPALRANLYADDWDHYAIEQGIYPVALPVWDMFNWVGARDAERDALLRSGRLPWWSSHDLQLSVFRPLASLQAHFDYAVLDGAHHPGLLHAHTLLWWFALLIGFAAVVQRVLPWPLAALSSALYALDDCFIMPYVWIANRSELVALALVVWALYFQLRHLDSGSLATRCAVAALVFAALCAGEHALAPLFYLFAVTLVCRQNVGSRARTLLPVVLIIATYIVVRAMLGYGVAGSGFYIDPVAEPLRYLRACCTRIPLLLGELLFSIPCEWSYGAPFPQTRLLLAIALPGSEMDGTSPSFVAAGVVAGAACLAALWWLRRREGQYGERAVTWLVAGALLSLLPLGGVMAQGRMTPAPAMGMDVLLAFLVWRAGSVVVTASQLWWRALALGMAVSVLYVAVYLPGRRSYDGANYMAGTSNGERHWIEDADYGVDSLAGKHVLVLSARDLASQLSIPYIVHAAGRPMPETARVLSARGDKPQLFRRISERSFELIFAYPPRPESFTGSVYRSDADAMQVGDAFASPLFAVTVLEAASGQPMRLRFDFVRALDSPDLVFMVAERRRFTRFAVPAIGVPVVIAPAQGP